MHSNAIVKGKYLVNWGLAEVQLQHPLKEKGRCVILIQDASSLLISLVTTGFCPLYQ